MIGLALVSFVAVFAAGLRGSIDDAIDKTFAGDLIVSNDDGFSDIPAEDRRPRSAASTGSRSPRRSATRRTEVKGIGDGFLTLVDPRTAAEVLTLDWQEGSQELLTELGARRRGDRREAGAPTTASGSATRFEAKTASRRGRSPTRSPARSRTTPTSSATTPPPTPTPPPTARATSVTNVFVNLGRDADADHGPRDDRRDARTAEFPTVKSEDQEELKDSIAEQLNALLGVVYALLLLAVIVSLFGIVNTLALSIHERTRELGLLRAVGTSRRQVRRIVRYEAVITALIGAVLGAVLGVVFAVVVSRPLADEGFTLSIPVGTLIAAAGARRCSPA